MIRRWIARRLHKALEAALPAQWARGEATASGQLLGTIAWVAAGVLMVAATVNVVTLALIVWALSSLG